MGLFTLSRLLIALGISCVLINNGQSTNLKHRSTYKINKDLTNSDTYEDYHQNSVIDYEINSDVPEEIISFDKSNEPDNKFTFDTNKVRHSDELSNVDQMESIRTENLPSSSPNVVTQLRHGATPNVVILLVDDLGYGDLGSGGHPTSHTPAIDALAARGKRLTKFYVTSPVCSPSRASLLTGRYQVRSGVYPGTFVPESVFGLPNNETTIATMLKGKGYRTLIVGKWHLGVGVNNEFLPASHGFDDYLGLPYSHDMCPCLECYDNDRPCYDTCWGGRVSCPLYHNTTITQQPVHLPSLTQRYVDKAKHFMAECAAEERPFFLYVPFQHVHHPQFSSSKYENSSNRGQFGDGLLELDGAVDQLLEQLQRLSITNDTLVWLTSDNGPSLQRHERGGCAGPLRCGKGTTWEGGVRVPSLVSWPGTIPPGHSDALVTSLDILPTLASITNAPLPTVPLDGVDVGPLLLGDGKQSPRSFFAVYPETPTQEEGPFAVVWGRYKAHFYTKGSSISDNDNYDHMCTENHPLTSHEPPLLYDLDVDPGERWNIGNGTEHRATIATMTAWRTQHMESMTWQRPLTAIISDRAQPCCNSHNCEPFPTCCDCPVYTTKPSDLKKFKSLLWSQYISH